MYRVPRAAYDVQAMHLTCVDRQSEPAVTVLCFVLSIYIVYRALLILRLN